MDFSADRPIINTIIVHRYTTGRPAITFKSLDLSLLIVLRSKKVTNVAGVVY